MNGAEDSLMAQSPFDEPGRAPACAIVLFGATGDLAARKIAPAIYNLAREKLLGEETFVLATGRRDWDDQELRCWMRQAIDKHSRSGLDSALWERLARRWFYHRVPLDHQEAYTSLAERLAQLEATGGNRLIYLAVRPEHFPLVVDHLAAAGLNSPSADDRFTNLVVEKPFGHDLPSARALNTLLLERFEESQIFRIDHYLGKETVQNILVFRFANAIFDELLNRDYVDHVQITTAETVGMEGRRGPYYEKTGALRDMIQNHMLQLLALTAMDVPSCLGCEAIRGEKAKVLQSIPPLSPAEVAECTVRGQYSAGEGTLAYRQEQGVASDSQVETYAAVRLFVENWRWSGVPFYLRTGKRLAAKASQILVVFKREPIDLFSRLGCDMRGPNTLRIRINPDEGISIGFDAKVPGQRMLIRPVKMDFSYETAFESASPEAYEHLLLDAICGQATLFIRKDEAEEAWRIVDSIRNSWDVNGLPKLIQYTPGTWGPEEADRLFPDPYKRWHLT